MEMTSADKDRTIITHLAAKQRELQAGCECGGSGEVNCKFVSLHDIDGKHAYYAPDGYQGECGSLKICLDCNGTWKIPCSTCAPIRELELCWHESMEKRMYTCKHCGVHPLDQFPHPNFTTALHGTKWLLRHYLEVLGMWEEFVEWHDRNTHANISHPLAKAYTWKNISQPAIHASADILTDGLLLRDAVYAWMEVE